jgi:hypothetical protein
MVKIIIPRNVEVTNIDSYVCYKVRKLSSRNTIFQGKKLPLSHDFNPMKMGGNKRFQ